MRRSHEQLQLRLNETSRAKADADAELARRQQAIERLTEAIERRA